MIHLVTMGNPAAPESVPDERATEPILLLAMSVTRVAGAALISARCGPQKEAGRVGGKKPVRTNIDVLDGQDNEAGDASADLSAANAGIDGPARSFLHTARRAARLLEEALIRSGRPRRTACERPMPSGV
jgi:hypothetical protein